MSELQLKVVHNIVCVKRSQKEAVHVQSCLEAWRRGSQGAVKNPPLSLSLSDSNDDELGTTLSRNYIYSDWLGLFGIWQI